MKPLNTSTNTRQRRDRVPRGQATLTLRFNIYSESEEDEDDEMGDSGLRPETRHEPEVSETLEHPRNGSIRRSSIDEVAASIANSEIIDWSYVASASTEPIAGPSRLAHLPNGRVENTKLENVVHHDHDDDEDPDIVCLYDKKQGFKLNGDLSSDKDDAEIIDLTDDSETSERDQEMVDVDDVSSSATTVRLYRDDNMSNSEDGIFSGLEHEDRSSTNSASVDGSNNEGLASNESIANGGSNYAPVQEMENVNLEDDDSSIWGSLVDEVRQITNTVEQWTEFLKRTNIPRDEDDDDDEILDI